MDDAQRRTVSAFLREGAWFGGLGVELQDLILDRSEIRSYRKGEAVSREGDPPLGLYAVLEGRLWLLQHVGRDTENLLHVAEPGFWGGEFAVLTGRPVAVTILAHTPARTLLLPRTAFEEIATFHPPFYRAAAQLALSRFGIMLRHVSEAYGATAEGRLRLVLADRAEMRQWDRLNERPVCLTLSQEELARLSGLSRQTLNGLLQKLQNDGLIDVAFRRIYVLDLAGLRRKL
jgi:CRP-like cAMP-binding protein